MSTFTLEVQLPEGLRELGFGDEEICREVPILLVMKRFREGMISSGRAARILGMSRREFLDRLAHEGFPIYDPTDAELAQELQTVQPESTPEGQKLSPTNQRMLELLADWEQTPLTNEERAVLDGLEQHLKEQPFSLRDIEDNP